MSNVTNSDAPWTDKGTGNVPLTDLSAPVEVIVDNTSTNAVPGPPTSVTHTFGIPGLADANDQSAEETKSIDASDDVATTDDKSTTRKRAAKKES